MILLFPIGSAEKPRRQPLVTMAIILFSLVVYVAMAWSDLPRQQILDRWGYVPNESAPVTFLTSLFMHSGLVEMLVNLWLLWLLAPLIESRLGHFPFLLLYLAGGLAAWSAVGALDPGVDRMMAHCGSSGALAAVMGAFLALYPFADIKVWYFFMFIFVGLFRGGVFRIGALIVIGLWFAVKVVMLMFSSQAAPVGAELLQQVGGFAFGAVAAIAGFGREGLERETSYAD